MQIIKTISKAIFVPTVMAVVLVASSFVGLVPVKKAHAQTIGTGWTAPLGSMPGLSGTFLESGCNGGTYISGQYHLGNDYGASPGTPVYAIGTGTVIYTGSFGAGWANAIFVRHQAADGSDFVALYGHVNLGITNGATVSAGQQIGTVADISADHLHFAIRPGTSYPSNHWGMMPCPTSNGTNGFVDPIPYLSAHAAGSPPVTIQPSAADSAYGQISAVLTSNGSMNIFGTNFSSGIETFWQPAPGNSMSGYGNITSSVKSSPVVVTTPNGSMNAFAVGAGGDLQTFWQPTPGSGFTGSASLGGNLKGAPAAVVAPNGTINVFAVDASNQLVTYWQPTPGSTFVGPTVIGSNIISSPSVVVAPGGSMNVFAINTSNQLQTFWQSAPGGNMTNTAIIAGGLKNIPPSVVVTPNGSMNVFAVGSAGDLQNFWQPTAGSSMTGFASIGGNIAGGIASVVAPGGTINVFAVNTSSQLQTFWQSTPGGNMTNTAVLAGGMRPATPSVLVAGGVMNVFALNQSNQVVSLWPSAPGGSFTNIATIGGSWR